jgi:hypothetical protein
MLTIYQKTELILGTVLFILFYFLIIHFSDQPFLYYDVIVTTIMFLIIMYLRYYFLNYYILQSQNFSSNTNIND